VRRRLNRLSLRIRLTVAFAGAAAVLLAGIGTFVVWRVQVGLDAELDHALRLRAAELAELEPTDPKLQGVLDAAGQPAQLLTSDGRVLASVRVRGAKPMVGLREPESPGTQRRGPREAGRGVTRRRTYGLTENE
jgi:hypothetical protein